MNTKIMICAGVIVMMVWGTSFICSKSLINNGFTPFGLFLLRTYIAYLLMRIFSKDSLFANNIKDEFLMFLLGLSGGSIYYLLENTSLEYTSAENVSFIVNLIPLFTAILSYFIYKNVKFKPLFFVGVVLSVVGVLMLVYNGKFVLHVSPLGDMIALFACLSWSIYSVLLNKYCKGYSIMFVTRKVFFYGLISLIPFVPFVENGYDVVAWAYPMNIINLLFLAVVSSFLCFLVWNFLIKHCGGVKISNLLYLSPVFTVVASFLFFEQVPTVLAIVGGAMILGGVYLCSNNTTDL